MWEISRCKPVRQLIQLAGVFSATSKVFGFIIIIMFIIFGLNKTQAWVPMALLLLCFTICPNSSYPHASEDEDLTGVESDGDNEDYQQQLAPNEDQDPEEEEPAVEAGAEDVENDNKEDCIRQGKKCKNASECCKANSPLLIAQCSPLDASSSGVTYCFLTTKAI